MPLTAAILAFLAAAQDTSPIVVTSHRWAPFISPMGEPYRARNTADDTLAKWFAKADANHDGVLTALEMQADADRFFALLDTDGDGEIGPEELTRYEWEVAPEIQVNTKRKRQPGEKADAAEERARKLQDEAADGDVPLPPLPKRRREEDGMQGAARYALLNIPQPVAAADADFNRGVSRNEFREAAAARFTVLDTAHAGRIGLAQLQALRDTMLTAARARPKAKAPDQRLGNPLPKSN